MQGGSARCAEFKESCADFVQATGRFPGQARGARPVAPWCGERLPCGPGSARERGAEMTGNDDRQSDALAGDRARGCPGRGGSRGLVPQGRRAGTPGRKSQAQAAWSVAGAVSGVQKRGNLRRSLPGSGVSGISRERGHPARLLPQDQRVADLRGACEGRAGCPRSREAMADPLFPRKTTGISPRPARFSSGACAPRTGDGGPTPSVSGARW